LSRNIIIGTRGSRLALWQANKVKSELEALDFACELKIIKTQGDRVQDLSFDKLEGKGFFTKEIEEALISKDIDVAVHSLKDLPTSQVEGLALAGLSERADPADILIHHPDQYDADKPLGLRPKTVVGTSSIRRKTQSQSLVENITVQDLRGNVPTRIQKLRDKKYDAIILAAAGVERLELDLTDLKVTRLHPKEFVPAPAQGVIAYQVRAADIEMRNIIGHIHHKETAEQTNIERRVLKMMDGGCHIPLGVYCEVDPAGNYQVFAAYAADNSTELIRPRLSQSTTHLLAERMVEKLLNSET